MIDSPDPIQTPDFVIAMLAGLPSKALRSALRAAERREYREQRLREVEAQEARVSAARMNEVVEAA